jgi:hypothetical protein
VRSSMAVNWSKFFVKLLISIIYFQTLIVAYLISITGAPARCCS